MMRGGGCRTAKPLDSKKAGRSRKIQKKKKVGSFFQRKVKKNSEGEGNRVKQSLTLGGGTPRCGCRCSVRGTQIKLAKET